MTSGAADTYQDERRYLRKDGTVVWGRLTATVVRPAKGKPMLAIGMIENVSERRRMEEAVRSSERLRALIYDSVTDVLFYLGVEGDNRYRFLSVNQAFLKATGLREDQVVHRLVDEVIPEPARTMVLGHYARAIHERRTISWDETSQYPAGVKYGEVSITPVFDGGGKCTNLVGTVHDVTERRKAEERLAAQAAMLDNAKDAIILRDVDGLVQSWNKGAERLYGWSSAEATGRNVLDLIYRDPSVFQQANARLLEQGEWSGELAQVNKAGKPLVIDGSWTLFRDEQGRPRSVVAIHTDVTEKRRLEAQVLRAQRLDSLGAQAGGIAHDFNNLLMVIGEGLRQGLEDLGPDHPAREALKGVETAVMHGASLTRQMLTFSGQQESSRKLVKLDRVVAEALGVAAGVAAADGAHRDALRRASAGDPGGPHADPADRHEPGQQRLPRHDPEGHAGGAGGTGAAGRAGVDRIGGVARRQLREAGGHRHGRGHGRGHARTHLRPAVHHQAGGRGDRPGAVGRPWHREEPPRRHRGAQHSRPRFGVQPVFSRCPARPRCQRGPGEPAARKSP